MQILTSRSSIYARSANSFFRISLFTLKSCARKLILLYKLWIISLSLKVRRRYLNCLQHPMATVCNLCSGPIVPPDMHLFCIACMGLAHAESALRDGGSCDFCADMSLRALKARRDEARAAAGIGPAAATEPLAGPPDRGVEVRPPVSFPDPSFQPPREVADFVSFGASEEEDSMSLSASENDWGAEQAAPLTTTEQEAPADLQEELFRILSKAVEELDLSWKAPDEPSKSKLDTWFLQSSRRQAASRRGTPFFPDVHEHVVKSWAAPQSARTLTSTQAMFAPVDEAGDHGYLRIPPVEETVAAHLCPSAPALGSDRSLPSRACRFTAHQANKAYGAAGEAVSALHAMAVLQVLQAKQLKSLDGAASVDADAIRDLRSATDLALLATKRSAQAIGRSMGYLVVLHRHLWLTLSDVQEADRKTLLNAPISPAGLFGDAVEKVTERYSETQKKAKAMSHVIPRRAPMPPPPQPRSRSSSASGRQPQAAARRQSASRPGPDARKGRSGQWHGAGNKRPAQRSPRRKPTASPARPKQSS
jgi:hypothetical protein